MNSTKKMNHQRKTMPDTLKKLEVPFTQVANSVLNDSRISAKAKGMFAYLCSKPWGSDFSSERIQLDFTDSVHSVRNTLKELELYGYLKRKKERNGKMTYLLTSWI